LQIQQRGTYEACLWSIDDSEICHLFVAPVSTGCSMLLTASDALARHTRQLYNHLQQNTNFGGGGAAQGATAVTAFP
jgi:hypothetical protein